MGVIKTCDLSGHAAAKLFVSINHGRVKLVQHEDYETLVTDIDPRCLDYPEGWYYAKGNFRNKHNSTTGAYSEITMQKSNGEYWNL